MSEKNGNTRMCRTERVFSNLLSQVGDRRADI